MSNLPQRTVIALVVLALANVAWANDLFVAQKDPAAADKNPGTEAKPFKTIQAAVDKVQAGDTIWVKAGNYGEPVLITKPGTEGQPITLSAWKDDRVQLGSRPRPLPVEGEWKPIEGTKCWQIKLNQDVPDDFQVLLNGKAVLTFMKDTPPTDEKIKFQYNPKSLDMCAAYRKSDRTLMFNAKGKNPATLGKIEYARNFRGNGFFSIGADWWVIQRLEFSWLTQAISFGRNNPPVGDYNYPVVGGNNCVVEDCFFTHCYNGAIGISGERRMDIIRRCNFYRAGCAIGCSAPGISHIIENNLMVDCSLAEDENLWIAINPGTIPDGGYGATCFKGSNLGMIFAHNIVSDGSSQAPGWYADCDGAQGCRLIGNAFWNGSWVYNEAMVNDSFVQGNVFYRADLTSRYCTRLNVVENLFYESGVTWSTHDEASMRYGYMLLRKNAFVHSEVHGQGYLSDQSAGGRSMYPEAFRQCMVDYNRVWAPQGAVLINDGGAGKKYTSLEEIRKEFGWERHGEALPYEKDTSTPQAAAQAMGGGVVTFRIPWGKYSAEARPMLSDPSMEGVWPVLPFSVCDSNPPFFWRIADGNYDPRPLSYYSYIGHHQYWYAMSGPTSENRGCRWYRDVEPKNPDGNHFLVMEGLHPDKMLPQGVGYWTPYLGAAPGAKVTVSLKMRGQGLQPTEKGTPAVWLQFTDETNQHRRRSFLVGKDDGGTMHRPECIKGDFKWTEVKDTITAPEGAVRMALFFGLLPCAGKIEFDDVDIQTAGEAAPVAAEILPSNLPPQVIKDTFYVDLSKAANRALADDADNDGKGGWTDQGPDADMREFKTGERRFGGVPFKILPSPKSVVVLKSVHRGKGDLPEKVAIPIGRKFDTLFFLHAGAWFGGGSQFKYVVHYADGKDVEIPVNGQNMKDWTAEPVARFPLEEGTFSTVAQTVKVPQFGRGSVYRMEWSAPLDRRPVEIKSIEFIGDGRTVPVLLGITGVTEW